MMMYIVISCIIMLGLMIILICCNCNILERFINGKGLSILDTLQQSKQIYEIRKDRIEEEVLDVESDVYDAYKHYKNIDCNKHSTFYKYNVQDNFKLDDKFYVRPKIESGKYSIKEDKCVHRDPSFKPLLDCSHRLNCIDGNPIYGQLTTKNFEQVCEYNCEDIVL